jgi:hypothetical protein
MIPANHIGLAQGGDAEMTKSKPHLYELGKMTVFYVPSHKLDDPRFFPQDPKVEATAIPQGVSAQTARSTIHEFLMRSFRAYTQTPTPVKGCWVDPQGQQVHDVMERFEVSFEKEGDFHHLIEFLVEMCDRLKEEAIYVTRGDRSFLVQRAA